jgi:uncharacterized phage protein (TIGR02218 family)
MKTRSIALAASQAAGSTTLAWCWKATRRDGYVLAVTTCARDLLFNGVLYVSKNGFNPKAISQEATAAVVNTEVEGALSPEITEADFESGKWDGCTVEMIEVNYRSLSDGAMKLATFTMGDIKVTRSAFNAEMRGLTQRLQKTVGRVVTKGCDLVFGSISPDNYTRACNKPLGPLTVTSSFTGVVDRRTFSDSSRTEADDWFGAGVITINGESLEISSYNATTKTFVTYMPFLGNPAIGNAYTATPGCRKRFTEDCSAKFNNVANHGGFDKVPGPDKVLGLGGTEGTNL